jgi:hypothetical protein
MGLSALNIFGSVAKGLNEADAAVSKRNHEINLKKEELRVKNRNERAKTAHTAASKRYQKDVDLIDSITSANGIDTIEGQAIAKGYGVTEIAKMMEAKKIAGDSWKWATLPVLGDAPTLNQVEFDAEKVKQGGGNLGKLFKDIVSPFYDFETKEPVPVSDTSGAMPVSTYRRGKSEPLTDDQRTRLNVLKGGGDNEKKFQYQARKHAENIVEAQELYKDNMNSKEAKAAFATLKRQGDSLIYGKDSSSTTTWQTRMDLHNASRPDREDFPSDAIGTAAFKSERNIWERGYNYMVIGKDFEDSKTGAKQKPFEVWDKDNNKTKIMHTGLDTDSFMGWVGYKQMGGSDIPAAATGGLKIGDTKELNALDGSGKKVTAYYTGSMNDIYDGQPGWTLWGGASKPKDAFSEKKWNRIKKPIYDAIENGTKINPKQWNVYKLHILENKDSLSQFISQEMAELDKLARSGLEYPTLTIKIKGKKIPVKATLENMKIAATKSGKTIETIRTKLYNAYMDKHKFIEVIPEVAPKVVPEDGSPTFNSIRPQEYVPGSDYVPEIIPDLIEDSVGN